MHPRGVADSRLLFVVPVRCTSMFMEPLLVGDCFEMRSSRSESSTLSSAAEAAAILTVVSHVS